MTLAQRLVGRLFRRDGHPPTFYYVAKAIGKMVIVRTDDTEQRLMAARFSGWLRKPNWTEIPMVRK